MIEDGPNGPLSLAEAAQSYAESEIEGSEEEQPEDLDDVNDDESDDIETDDIDGEYDEQDDDQDNPDEEEEEAEEQLAEAVEDYQVSVKLPNGETATIQDLINGNEGRADTTRKQQALAAERGQMEQYAQRVEQYATQIEQLQELATNALQSVLGEPPSPDLATTDPVEYTRKKAAYDQNLAKLQELQGGVQAVQAQRTDQQSYTNQQQQVQMVQQLVERRPELRDPKKMQAYEARLSEGLTAFGFPPNALQMTNADPILQVFEAAVAHQENLKSTQKPGKKRTKRPPVVRGKKRSGSNVGKNKQRRIAMDRLNRSGHIKDGVAALIASENMES